jgi:hypothetical protein
MGDDRMKTGLLLLILVLAGTALVGTGCVLEIVTPEPIKMEVTIRQETHEYIHQVKDSELLSMLKVLAKRLGIGAARNGQDT